MYIHQKRNSQMLRYSYLLVVPLQEWAILICTTWFHLHDNQDMIQLKSPKKKLTISSILHDIQEKVGTHTFFNWHIYKNNCQTFTKQFFDCLDIDEDIYHSFINTVHGTSFAKHIELSDFNLHTINCIINAYEFLGTLYMNWF